MDIQSKTRRTLTVALLAATLVSGTAFACYTCYPGKLVVKKFYDKNANGVLDAGESLISGWPMTLDPGAITKNTVSGVYGYRPKDVFAAAISELIVPPYGM